MQIMDQHYLCRLVSWRSFDPISRSNLSRSSFCQEIPYVVRRGRLDIDRPLGGTYGPLKGVAGPKAGYVRVGNHDCRYHYCDQSFY